MDNNYTAKRNAKSKTKNVCTSCHKSTCLTTEIYGVTLSEKPTQQSISMIFGREKRIATQSVSTTNISTTFDFGDAETIENTTGEWIKRRGWGAEIRRDQNSSSPAIGEISAAVLRNFMPTGSVREEQFRQLTTGAQLFRRKCLLSC